MFAQGKNGSTETESKRESLSSVEEGGIVKPQLIENEVITIGIFRSICVP